MVQTENYFGKESGGQYLRADDCQVGDKLLVTGAGRIDDQRFDKPYLYLPVTLLRTNEPKEFRLGKRNINRIVDVLGKDTENWVNQHLEVIDLPYYQGVKSKGIMVRGLKVQQSSGQKLEQTNTNLDPTILEAIQNSKEIIEMGIGLTESDWNIIPAKTRAGLLKNKFVKQQDEFYVFTDKAKQYL